MEANRQLHASLAREIFREFEHVDLGPGIYLTRTEMSIEPDHPALQPCGDWENEPTNPEVRTAALLVQRLQNITLEDMLSKD